MFLTEYDQEKVLEQAVYDDRKRVATDMLQNGEHIAKIVKYSRLAEDVIRNLALSLGVNLE